MFGLDLIISLFLNYYSVIDTSQLQSLPIYLNSQMVCTISPHVHNPGFNQDELADCNHISKMPFDSEKKYTTKKVNILVQDKDSSSTRTITIWYERIDQNIWQFNSF